MSADLKPRTVEEGAEPEPEHPAISTMEIMVDYGVPPDIAELFAQMLFNIPPSEDSSARKTDPRDKLISKIRTP